MFAPTQGLIYLLGDHVELLIQHNQVVMRNESPYDRAMFVLARHRSASQTLAFVEAS